MDGGPREMSTVAWAAGILLVTVVAAVLRLWMPGPTVLTTDELNWNRRSAAFGTAFEQGDFAAMVSEASGKPATRPGVTTMWTGYAALKLTSLDLPGVARSDSLRVGHQLMATWCTLLLVPFMAISARSIGRQGALVAGGVVAVEPLAVGHSALLHTDALLAMTAGVAIVAVLATFDETRRGLGPGRGGEVPRWRRPVTRLGVVAGVAGAAAMLTKVSALVLLGGTALAALAVHAYLVHRSHRSWTVFRRSLIPTVVLPLAAAVVAILVLWPAMWVDPIGNVRDSIDSLSLADDPTPRLLLGEVVVGGDWRYYPVEMVFRTSTWLLMAIPVAIGWMFWRRSSGRPAVLSRRNSAVLTAAGILYSIGLLSSEKQYGRYLLPILPLVAVGIGAVSVDLIRVIRHRYRANRRHMPRFVVPALGLAALVLTSTWTLSLAPYQISHVNPLVGGQPVAERTIQLGWGEGKGPVLAEYKAQVGCQTWAGVGAWVTGCPNERQDFDFLDGGVPPPRYVFRYVTSRQTGAEPARLISYLRANGQLVRAVTIDGVNYAELWTVGEDEP